MLQAQWRIQEFGKGGFHVEEHTQIYKPCPHSEGYPRENGAPYDLACNKAASS